MASNANDDMWFADTHKRLRDKILIRKVSALDQVQDHKVYQNSKYLQSNAWRVLTCEEEAVVIWNDYHWQSIVSIVNPSVGDHFCCNISNYALIALISLHWFGDTGTKRVALAAHEVVTTTTPRAASEYKVFNLATFPLQWSATASPKNHRPLGCLFNILFRLTGKKHQISI